MRYVIRERFIHLGEDSDITDDQGRVIYQVDGKVFSLHNLLIVRDTRGNEVARVHRRLMALRPTYEISSDGQEADNLNEAYREKISPSSPKKLEGYTVEVVLGRL